LCPRCDEASGRRQVDLLSAQLSTQRFRRAWIECREGTRWRASIQYCLALGFDCVKQVLPRIVKGFRAFGLQIGAKFCDINPDSAEFGEHLFRSPRRGAE
jgi:hypothetical protein